MLLCITFDEETVWVTLGQMSKLLTKYIFRILIIAQRYSNHIEMLVVNF